VEDLYFSLRNEQVSEHHAMPKINQVPFQQLQVPPCIWKLDSSMMQAFIYLLSVLGQKECWRNKIYFHVATETYVFKWDCTTNKPYCLCWCKENQHQDLSQSTELVRYPM